uniref:Uncharacterized protein n=1 Tax=Steinernema glaseri TaxID=37863 RepID=A0A1I7Y047_9BILA
MSIRDSTASSLFLGFPPSLERKLLWLKERGHANTDTQTAPSKRFEVQIGHRVETISGRGKTPRLHLSLSKVQHPLSVVFEWSFSPGALIESPCSEKKIA